MIPFQQMYDKVSSSKHYNKMIRFLKPLNDHFGVNHFWYNRITCSGHYSFIGNHARWNEFFFSQDLIGKVPYFRHPDVVPQGISLMKNSAEFNELYTIAAEKFGINFNVFLLKRTIEGIEGFGFGTYQKLGLKDEFLLNELPLLTSFIKQFREENKNVFNIAYDNQVDVASHLGESFFQNERKGNAALNRNSFLKDIGFEKVLSLSKQERAILKFSSNGFSAPYIAKELNLSSRTVEHYIDNIKQKLDVYSKDELIIKAKKFVDTEPKFDF